MLEKIKQTAEYIRSCVQEIPSTAIILGTGLGALVDHIEDKNSYHIRKFRIFQYLQSKDIPAILSLAVSATVVSSLCKVVSIIMRDTT